MVEKRRLVLALALAASACEPASSPTVTMVPKEDASVAAADADVPAPSEPKKVANVPNRGALQAAIDRAGPGGVVSLYVRLDPNTAPKTADERKQALAAAGLGPQTVSGDVATLRMPADRLETLLAIPWVTSVETPSVSKPR